MQAPPPDNPIPSVIETAAILRVGKATVLGMFHADQLKGFRLGHRVLFHRDDVDACIEEMRSNGVTQSPTEAWNQVRAAHAHGAAD